MRLIITVCPCTRLCSWRKNPFRSPSISTYRSRGRELSRAASVPTTRLLPPRLCARRATSSTSRVSCVLPMRMNMRMALCTFRHRSNNRYLIIYFFLMTDLALDEAVWPSHPCTTGRPQVSKLRNVFSPGAWSEGVDKRFGQSIFLLNLFFFFFVKALWPRRSIANPAINTFVRFMVILMRHRPGRSTSMCASLRRPTPFRSSCVRAIQCRKLQHTARPASCSSAATVRSATQTQASRGTQQTTCHWTPRSP